MDKIYKTTEGLNINCFGDESKSNDMIFIFIPGIPYKIQNYDIFDKIIKTGYSVYIPEYFGSLGSKGFFNLDTNISTIICTLSFLISKHQNTKIILLGHSYGGFCILQSISKMGKILKKISNIYLFSAPLEMNDSYKGNNETLVKYLADERGFNITDDFLQGINHIDKNNNNICLKNSLKSLNLLSKNNISNVMFYGEDDEEIDYLKIKKLLPISKICIIKNKGHSFKDIENFGLLLNNIISICFVADIKSKLKNFVTAFIYGSSSELTLFNEKSDIDMNIFVKNSSFENIYIIREYIKKYESFFGIHMCVSVDGLDLPIIHKNRNLVHLYELNNTGIQIFGNSNDFYIDIKELIEECRFVSLTLTHEIQKWLIIGDNSNEMGKKIIKLSLNLLKILKILFGTKKDSFIDFIGLFNKNERCFYRKLIKMKCSDSSIIFQEENLLNLQKFVNRIYNIMCEKHTYVVDGFDLIYSWNSDLINKSISTKLGKDLSTKINKYFKLNRKNFKLGKLDINKTIFNVFGVSDYKNILLNSIIDNVYLLDNWNKIIQISEKKNLVLLTDSIFSETEVKMILGKLGIENKFKKVISSADVGKMKPSTVLSKLINTQKKYIGFIGHDNDELFGYFNKGYFILNLGNK